MLTNWARSRTYSAESILYPRTVEEVCAAVRSASKVRALGSRHSFSAVGDTVGTLVSTELLTAAEAPDADGRVKVGAGLSYGRLARILGSHGRALANFASLADISVGGAVATATHGSGRRNPSLASAVCALDLVLADGSQRTLERGDPDFDGAVVSLGALGVVTSLTLETVAAFDLRQYVFEDIPWEAAEEELAEILATGYSTSLFLTWAGGTVEQAWVKTPDELDAFYGGRAAVGARHPIAGGDPADCTDQLGAPGPASERLPHFRFEGLPSIGDELQSEYAVRVEDAGACVRALREASEGFAGALHIGEIRAVAADAYWLSPFCEQDSVTFHFTWKQEPAAEAAIRAVEEALAPWRPRPHWGKVFAYDLADVGARYPRLDAFLELRHRLDPRDAFANAFVSRLG